MRISDWSSDVCSSDLQREAEREETAHAVAEQHRRRGFLRPQSIQRALKAAGDVVGEREIALLGPGATPVEQQRAQAVRCQPAQQRALGREVKDRKSVVEGKSVAVRVNIGGWRITKKKKQTK